MAKPVILIAEDDLFLEQIYRRSLEAAGYDVLFAVSGREVLEKLASSRVDLLLLDLNMADVTGIQVLETMRADKKLATLPVIVLTNYSEEEYGQQCKDLGVKAFFTKSNLSFDMILDRIKNILRSKSDGSDAAKPVKATKPVSEASGAARVLVIEDDPFLLEIYKQNLKERGYDVSSAMGGREALEMINEDQNWSVILLDLLMPEIDGFTVLERLKEKGLVPGLPVIVLTNLSQESDQKKALELGAVDFAVKSELSFDEIVAHVEDALKKSKPTP